MAGTPAPASPKAPISINDTERSNYYIKIGMYIFAGIIMIGLLIGKTSGLSSGGGSWVQTIYDMDGNLVNSGDSGQYVSYTENSTGVSLSWYDQYTGQNQIYGSQWSGGFNTGEGRKPGWVCTWNATKSGGGAVVCYENERTRWVYVWRAENLGGGGILRKHKLMRTE